MTRVATIPLQRTMSGAIQRTEQQLAKTQAELSTQKKAPDFASLGTQAVRNLSAHTLLAQQDAQSSVASRVGTTLSLYDANMTSIDDVTSDLRTSILTAIGTGDAAGLQDAMNAAFDQFGAALNGTDAGVPLFSGSQGGQPFTPKSLADTLTVPADQVFTNDDVKASARVGDNLDVQYGITASDVGAPMYDAFKAMAALGPINGKLTQAQSTSLQQIVGQMDSALDTVRAYNADNGRRQSQIETLGDRADQRSLLLKGIISQNEDADLAQVATDLAQQQTMLQASYSVFSQLSGLSLVQYL